MLAEFVPEFMTADDKLAKGAEYYQEGNTAEASKWFYRAAEDGLLAAQRLIGVMRFEGSTVPQDYAEAAVWFRKAADQGDAKSQFYLGHMSEKGLGMPKDYAQAKQWYRKAAEQDYKGALEALEAISDKNLTPAEEYARKGAVFYEEGNFKEALPWIRKAAELGDADSQFRLGCMYLEGQGVKENKKQGVKWLRKAADQNHEEAAFALEIVEMDQTEMLSSSDF